MSWSDDHVGCMKVRVLSASEFKAKCLACLGEIEQHGESITITRRGKPVARLTAVARPRKRVDAILLRALTATMPPQAESAADLVRSMRDGDRY